MSKLLARRALSGVGSTALGEWAGIFGRTDVWHIQRRLTDAERTAHGVPAPYDIRGTAEEQRRIQAVLAEAPHLQARLQQL